MLKYILLFLLTVVLFGCSNNVLEDDIVEEPTIITLIGEEEITIEAGEVFVDPGATINIGTNW